MIYLYKDCLYLLFQKLLSSSAESQKLADSRDKGCGDNYFRMSSLFIRDFKSDFFIRSFYQELVQIHF